MGIITRVRKFCFDVATLGGLGNWMIGGWVAAFLAIPFLLISRVISFLMPSIYHWFILGFIIFVVVVIQIACGFLGERKPSVIVLDNMCGMTIGLFGISLDWSLWKIIFAGYIFFIVLNLFKPFLLKNRYVHKVESFPGAIGILTSDVVFGLIVNLSVRLMLFFVK